VLAWLEFAAILLGVAGAGFGVAAVARSLRERCPACRAKALATTDLRKCTGTDERGERIGWYETDYTCARCGAEFSQRVQDGLVPRELWNQGARVPPPAAEVRSPR